MLASGLRGGVRGKEGETVRSEASRGRGIDAGSDVTIQRG